MASWHDCERMQRERFHVQQSLTDDLPVLIPATPLPRGSNGGSERYGASPSAASGLPSAVHIGADDQAQAFRGISGGTVGPVLTNDNAVSEQSLSRTRSLTAEGVSQ